MLIVNRVWLTTYQQDEEREQVGPISDILGAQLWLHLSPTLVFQESDWFGSIENWLRSKFKDVLYYVLKNLMLRHSIFISSFPIFSTYNCSACHVLMPKFCIYSDKKPKI